MEQQIKSHYRSHHVAYEVTVYTVVADESADWGKNEEAPFLPALTAQPSDHRPYSNPKSQTSLHRAFSTHSTSQYSICFDTLTTNLPPSTRLYPFIQPPQLSERSTIMAKFMNNHSSSSNQMQRFLDEESQSVLATCYSVESSTTKVHGFHYCTTPGAGKQYHLQQTTPYLTLL